MSMYLVFDGVMGQQVASNKGWGDFCRWIDTIPSAGVFWLKKLVDRGEATAGPVGRNLAIIRSPDPDVESVRQELLRQLRENPDAEMVGVSDGLSR